MMPTLSYKSYRHERTKMKENPIGCTAMASLTVEQQIHNTTTSSSAVDSEITTPAVTRILIVFVSLMYGNTRKAVTELSKLISDTPGHVATVVELKDTRERTGFFGVVRSCYDTYTRNITTLAPEDPSLADLSYYNHIVIGGPVWGYTMCTPVLTWVRTRKPDIIAAINGGSRIHLLSTQRSSGHVTALRDLRTELQGTTTGSEVSGDVACCQKELDNDSYKAKLSQWASDNLFKH
ncbi:hypothetical protein Pelo_17109 [Pelomyxa schiedti]|nr:hypothetical protein Pelo_17109 [Pelomyxa schiedti]